MKIATGLDNLILSPGEQDKLRGNLAYLGHSASVSWRMENGLDEMVGLFGNRVVKAFGPQHGFGSVVQDNMIETGHIMHPAWNIPVFSLYGETRKPTDEMLEGIDTLIIDLQDVGTRVYTYIWTLYLTMEACLGKDIRIVVLDRGRVAAAGRHAELMQTSGYYARTYRLQEIEEAPHAA